MAGYNFITFLAQLGGKDKDETVFQGPPFFFLKIHSLDLCMVVPGLSLVSASRGYSLVVACSLLAAVASLVAEHGL